MAYGIRSIQNCSSAIKLRFPKCICFFFNAKALVKPTSPFLLPIMLPKFEALFGAMCFFFNAKALVEPTCSFLLLIMLPKFEVLFGVMCFFFQYKGAC